MEHIFRSLKAETYETLQVQMAKLKVMEGHLIETRGKYDSFGPIAERMLNDQSVRSFLFAPEGIVRGAFPLKGNEPVLGLNMNNQGAGNLEARSAIESKNLILAGPFELVEGGIGICGRMPVYLSQADGTQKYWGLVAVTLHYPEIFRDSSIARINEQGYGCRIWRINPDTEQDQTILDTDVKVAPHLGPKTFEMELFHTTWYVTLSPLTPWYMRYSLWVSVLASLLTGALVGYGIYLTAKMKRVEEEAHKLRIKNLTQKLEQEESKRLLSQIRSHFFYHTLNTLQGLIVLQPKLAVKMIGDFSKYLRFNLNSSNNSDGIVAFKEEIRATRAYAQINEAQLGDRLHVIFDVGEEEFDIPALTVEPIVENAILHGIKPKVGGGTVCIRVHEEEHGWRVIVEDDGMGFAADDPTKLHSIGLKNIEQRLSRFAGCKMEINSRVGVGTCVQLYFTKNIKNISKG